MDYADYHVVYVDNRISRDLDGKCIQRTEARRSHGAGVHNGGSWEDRNPDSLKAILGEIEEVRSNLRNLLSVFNEVHTCLSGDTCMNKVLHLDSLDTEIQPVLVMLGTPAEGDNEDQSTSRRVEISDGASSEVPDFYGLALLQHIATELSNSTLSKLVVPISMFHKSEPESVTTHQFSNTRLSRPSSGGFPKFGPKSSSPRRTSGKNIMVDSHRTSKCVDIGAIDVLTSPLQEDRLRGLSVHGYRARKEMLKERAKFLAQKKARKQSWLGSTEDKKYGYLREAMVSTLMKGICNPDEAMQIIDLTKLPNPEQSRHAGLAKAVGIWGFSGHDYSEDELVHAAFLMLQHALSIPELEKWRLSTVELKTFLMASRAAYNGFVNYHNFRHVVDVMQAIFYFLVQIGTLPPYPTSMVTSSGEAKATSPIGALLKPFDALTLLITAIGHDVGHPGVNNAFLVALNAPLAQLYNDNKIQLESAKLEISGLKKPSDGLLSPKSSSPDRSLSQPELSHPEGLPASQPMESSPLAQLALAAKDAQTAEDSRRASTSSVQPHLGSLDGTPQSIEDSRRSSLTYPFSNIDSNPASTSYSRRSSGASPAAYSSHATVTGRRSSNSSPSQLQLGPSLDSRSQTTSSGTAASENRQPSVRISEDTLSQTQLSGAPWSSSSSRRNSRGSGGAGDVRRGSKGNEVDEPRSNRFILHGSSDRPYTQMTHHRSSSGAHTNNTVASQSTPYSPTGTQATSVLTIDSDGKRSHEGVDSWASPERKGMPAIVSMEGQGSGQRLKIMNGHDAARDDDVVKTSVVNHNSFRENGHHRVVGRKNSRFNFNFWKKRKSAEATP
ncbi:hypothetical protein P7C71_g1, partial [Lecanoromycetidae sp. Uapishka_2]